MKKTAEGKTTYSRRDMLRFMGISATSAILAGCASQADLNKANQENAALKSQFDALSSSLTKAPAPTSAPTATKVPEATPAPTASATAETASGGAGYEWEEGFKLANGYPETDQRAADFFGGDEKFWRKDLYAMIGGKRYSVVDGDAYDSEGKKYSGTDTVKPLWGGAFVAEAFNKRTDDVQNPDGTLYNYKEDPQRFHLTLKDELTKIGLISATWYDGKTQTYGTGSHGLNKDTLVEQAVVWQIGEKEQCTTDIQKQAIASQNAMRSLFSFLSTKDPNTDKLNVMVWDPRKKAYKTYKPGELKNIIDVNFEMENLPTEGYPLTPQEAAEQFGGTPEQWKQDIYKVAGNKDKWGFTWGFTWVFEQGAGNRDVIHISDPAMRMTFWEGTKNTYGAGGSPKGELVATPYPVEQAVVRLSLPTNVCLADDDKTNPDLLLNGVGADIRSFVKDNRSRKVNAMVYEPTKKAWQTFNNGTIIDNVPSWLQ